MNDMMLVNHTEGVFLRDPLLVGEGEDDGDVKIEDPDELCDQVQVEREVDHGQHQGALDAGEEEVRGRCERGGMTDYFRGVKEWQKYLEYWVGMSPVKRRPNVSRLRKLARSTLAWWMYLNQTVLK